MAGASSSSDARYEVNVHASLGEIGEAAWSALSGASFAPFLSYRFLDALERTKCVGDEAGWTPHHLTFWRGEELCAAAPAYLKENSEGEFVFDWAWAGAAERAGIPYYPKLVVAIPFTPATGPRLLVAREEERPRLMKALAAALHALVEAHDISGAHVLFPRVEEAEALVSSGMHHRLGTQFHWENHGYTTFDDYLSKFSSKRRNQIKRERREMEKQGIEIVTEQGKDLSPEQIDTVYELYLTTVDKFTWGRRYLNRAFFEEACKHVPGMEVVLAREGKKIVGGAVNLAADHTLFGRYWGAFEERPFLHFNVCFYHSIEQCISKGIQRFEPGAGGQHKLVRGFEPRLTHSAHHLAHPGLSRAIGEFLARERVMQRANVAEGETAAFR